jgi:hypothetical protein
LDNFVVDIGPGAIYDQLLFCFLLILGPPFDFAASSFRFLWPASDAFPISPHSEFQLFSIIQPVYLAIP